jgi:nicotinamidase-related amidase
MTPDDIFSPCFFVIVDADNDFCINEESMEEEGGGECVSSELLTSDLLLILPTLILLL